MSAAPTANKRGVTIQIRGVTLKAIFYPDRHTILDVKKAYRDEVEPYVDLNNVVLIKGNQRLEDDTKKLAYYNITNFTILMMVRRFEGDDDYNFVTPVRVNKPRVNKPKPKPKTPQPDYRQHAAGLNIEFQHNGQRVIGQVGYTTDHDKFPRGVFEAHQGRCIKMARCPDAGVCCPNHDAISRFWFNDCKVFFNGEMTNGRKVERTQTYGNKPTLYKDVPSRYANLEMIVTPK